MNPAEIQAHVAALADAVARLQANLLALGDTRAWSKDLERQRSLAPTRGAHGHGYPAAWPRVGGRADLAPTAGCFSRRAFRDRFEPGAKREIYVAGCEGLRRLAATLKLQVNKVSTCAAGRLLERLAELGRDRYASAWIEDGRYVDEPEGFDVWRPAQVRLAAPPASGSPVALSPRALIVTLPSSMSPLEFDHAFDAEVQKASVVGWLATPEGRRYCAWRGVDPALARRLTLYSYGDAARASPAVEIVAFEIRRDFDRLVAIAETVILAHLGLMP